MKIGDFAKKYGLNITTVRYYVERALLTPERKNNQYVFTPSCMEDMEKILKYKSFRWKKSSFSFSWKKPQNSGMKPCLGFFRVF